MIKCSSCSQEFKAISEEDCCGLNCSSKIEGDYVFGRYGSEIDQEKWKFINRQPSVKDGIICDNCIKKLKKTEQIEFDCCGYW